MTVSAPDLWVDEEGVLQKERRCRRSLEARAQLRAIRHLVGVLFVVILALLAICSHIERRADERISELRRQHAAEFGARSEARAREMLLNLAKPDLGSCRDFPVHMELEPVTSCIKTVYRVNQ